MARSGSYNFTLTRNNLITQALRSVNLIAKNETPPSDMMDFAANTLNMMIKAWQCEGIQLWNRRRGYLFTQYQTEQYTVGPTGDECSNSYIKTQLNGALASGATAVTVDSTTGMTVADRIGIALSDSTRFWTTIATIPTSTTLTLTDAITATAADDAYVLTYTSKIQRPLQIFQATKRDITSNTDVPISPVSFDMYFNLPVKESDGAPSLYYYDETLDNGTMYLYTRPNDVNLVIAFSYHEPLEDVDTATQDFDFPTQWLEALSLNLAVRLCYAYGKYPELERLEPRAEQAKLLMSWFDTDEEDIVITVGMNGY